MITTVYNPHAVVRPAVTSSRRQVSTRGHISMAENSAYIRDVGGSSPSARTSTMNTQTANIHLELLQLTSAGMAVCVLA